MKLTPYKLTLQLAVVLLISIGCAGQSETESGIKYEMITKGTGEVPPEGGTWALNLAYFNHDGDTMFASHQGEPIYMPYMKENMPNNASFEECFSILGKGDSAIFMVSADSLFKNSYRRPTPPEYQGKMVELRVSVEDIYTKEEYDAKLLEDAKEQMEAEKKAIDEYLMANNLTAEVTDEGVFYVITEQGDGPVPTTGQRVKVNYTGALLTGEVFDSSIEEVAKANNIFNPARPYGPIEFGLGQGEVIRGWDIGVGLLSVGSKAKLIIPSPLAYGERGAGSFIKPNSTLVFDVELVEIVE